MLLRTRNLWQKRRAAAMITETVTSLEFYEATRKKSAAHPCRTMLYASKYFIASRQNQECSKSNVIPGSKGNNIYCNYHRLPPALLTPKRLRARARKRGMPESWPRFTWKMLSLLSAYISWPHRRLFEKPSSKHPHGPVRNMSFAIVCAQLSRDPRVMT